MESDLEGFVVHPYHSKLLHSLFFQVIEGEDAHEQKWRGVNDRTCLSRKHLSAANHQSQVANDDGETILVWFSVHCLNAGIQNFNAVSLLLALPKVIKIISYKLFGEVRVVGSERQHFGYDLDDKVMLAILFGMFNENFFDCSPQKCQLFLLHQLFPFQCITYTTEIDVLLFGAVPQPSYLSSYFWKSALLENHSNCQWRVFQELRQSKGCLGRGQSGSAPFGYDLDVCLDGFLHVGERVDDGLKNSLEVAVVDLLFEHFLRWNLGMEVWIIQLIDVGVDFLVKAKSVFQLLCLGLALLSADVDKMLS